MNIPTFDSPRNHEYTGYICQCFSCGHQYLGPKRSVMCKLCMDGKKPVDNGSDNK